MCDSTYFDIQLKEQSFLLEFYFDKYINPKRLIFSDDFYDKNKIDRLLYISGLEYTYDNEVFDEYEIYLYTLADFDKCLQILKVFYGGTTFTYNREEVARFYG